MRWEKVNLSTLAQDVINELKEQEPDRNVECRITKDCFTEGDPHLLKIILQNLLGNAWKFTSKHPQPAIEFGITNSGSNPVFYVKDNGAGFDMAYKDKLFGAFQRLHSMTEFSGTGIGLATVQRIINRHGGTVWGEGEVGKGATFYFSI